MNNKNRAPQNIIHEARRLQIKARHLTDLIADPVEKELERKSIDEAWDRVWNWMTGGDYWKDKVGK